MLRSVFTGFILFVFASGLMAQNAECYGVTSCASLAPACIDLLGAAPVGADPADPQAAQWLAYEDGQIVGTYVLRIRARWGPTATAPGPSVTQYNSVTQIWRNKPECDVDQSTTGGGGGGPHCIDEEPHQQAPGVGPQALCPVEQRHERYAYSVPSSLHHSYNGSRMVPMFLRDSGGNWLTVFAAPQDQQPVSFADLLEWMSDEHGYSVKRLKPDEGLMDIPERCGVFSIAEINGYRSLLCSERHSIPTYTLERFLDVFGYVPDESEGLPLDAPVVQSFATLYVDAGGPVGWTSNPHYARGALAQSWSAYDDVLECTTIRSVF